MVLVLFCLAIGGVLGWGAWSQARDHWTLASRGVAAEGRVLGYEEVRGRRSTTTYPVLGFRTPDGRVVRARSGVSATPSELPAGSPVRVVYDPADPASNARTAAALAAGPGVTPWILGGLATLMAALGVALALPRRAAPAAAAPPDGPAREPIATAPRDGTEILVHCQESTPDPAGGTRSFEVARPARFDRTRGSWVTTDQWRDTVYPASWSRLPHPPH
jgi:hypothetical protein